MARKTLGGTMMARTSGKRWLQQALINFTRAYVNVFDIYTESRFYTTIMLVMMKHMTDEVTLIDATAWLNEFTESLTAYATTTERATIVALLNDWSSKTILNLFDITKEAMSDADFREAVSKVYYKNSCVC